VGGNRHLFRQLFRHAGYACANHAAHPLNSKARLSESDAVCIEFDDVMSAPQDAVAVRRFT
jgi:hypothetical protein